MCAYLSIHKTYTYNEQQTIIVCFQFSITAGLSQVHDNELECLPSAVGGLCKLSGLQASHNRLCSLHPLMFTPASCLATLNLAHNRLRGVPAEIGCLGRLRVLVHTDTHTDTHSHTDTHTQDLSNNQLESLPAEIVNLSQLCHLTVSHNRISRLPCMAQGLISLQEFMVKLWSNKYFWLFIVW